MRYLTLAEVLKLYSSVIHETGGDFGIRDLELLKSCLEQIKQTFDNQELYPV